MKKKTSVTRDAKEVGIIDFEYVPGVVACADHKVIGHGLLRKGLYFCRDTKAYDFQNSLEVR